jgi:acid phosphatase family membrane protein YuiD
MKNEILVTTHSLLDNHVLIAGFISWILAQSLKLPIDYCRTHRWNWALLFSAGGMPSSHTALMISTTLAIGLYQGFDSSLFALAVAMTMIVIYDAAGVRRQAGIHAQKINLLINELFTGQPITDTRLKEVLGHTPREVFGGAILGIVDTVIVYLIWPPR